MSRNISVTNQSTAMGGDCDGCTFSSPQGSVRVVRLRLVEFRLCPPCVEIVMTGLERGSIHENIPGESEYDAG